MTLTAMLMRPRGDAIPDSGIHSPALHAQLILNAIIFTPMPPVTATIQDPQAIATNVTMTTTVKTLLQVAALWLLHLTHANLAMPMTNAVTFSRMPLAIVSHLGHRVFAKIATSMQTAFQSHLPNVMPATLVSPATLMTNALIYTLTPLGIATLIWTAMSAIQMIHVKVSTNPDVI